MKLWRILSAFIAAIVLSSSLGCASTFSTSTDGIGGYIDDSLITAKVMTAIYDEPNLKALNIRVRTNNGIVRLSGQVERKVDIKAAVSVARRVDGVVSVRNRIKLKKQYQRRDS